jgi:non-specific serine/threonine protein kinase
LAARLRIDPKAVAVDAWLAALRSQDPKVAAPDKDLLELSETLAAWHRTESADSDPVRTCFRIVPPPDEPDQADPALDAHQTGPAGQTPHAGPQEPKSRKRRRANSETTDWRIEFALQAVDDPSLLVTADSVWADGAELTALERHVAHPDEHLLKGPRTCSPAGALPRPGPDRSRTTRAGDRRRRRPRILA